MDRGAWWATVRGVAESWMNTTEWLHFHFHKNENSQNKRSDWHTASSLKWWELHLLKEHMKVLNFWGKELEEDGIDLRRQNRLLETAVSTSKPGPQITTGCLGSCTWSLLMWISDCLGDQQDSHLKKWLVAQISSPLPGTFFLTFLKSAICWQGLQILSLFFLFCPKYWKAWLGYLSVGIVTDGRQASAPESTNAQTGCSPTGVRDE